MEKEPVSDEPWETIEPLLPPEPPKRGHSTIPGESYAKGHGGARSDAREQTSSKSLRRIGGMTVAGKSAPFASKAAQESGKGRPIKPFVLSGLLRTDAGLFMTRFARSRPPRGRRSAGPQRDRGRRPQARGAAGRGSSSGGLGRAPRGRRGGHRARGERANEARGPPPNGGRRAGARGLPLLRVPFRRIGSAAGRSMRCKT